MEMKRTSLACFGAQGSKDSLVYHEIPGKDGGEEFFVFFLPGEPAQEPFLRTLFREAVSTSRLGAPEHYFALFIDHFKTLTQPGGADGDTLKDALIMIHIRRGNDAYLLCNRDASLVHWDGKDGWHNPVESLGSFYEISIGRSSDQRDLFHRAPEDIFALYRFTIGKGEHTLILAPSNEFIVKHSESLRNSVFFPSFEFPREVGIELAVTRSFPAIRWRDGDTEAVASQEKRSIARPRRLGAPVVAGAIAAAVAIVVFFSPFLKHQKTEAPKESGAYLGVEDNGKGDTIQAPTRKPASDPNAQASEDAGATDQLRLSEAWRAQFKNAVTSSPRCRDGKVYFGCRDGYFYAFTASGALDWKYRSSAGIGASPCCVPGRVICANYRGDLFCLDANTGAAIWSLATGSKIVGSPQAIGETIVAGTMDGRLVAARLGDGKKLWEKKIGSSIWSSPATGSDFIIAATKDGFLVRLDTRGKVLWKANVGGGIFSSPLCIKDRDLIVFGSASGNVYGYTLSSGKRAWRFAAGSEIDGSPVSGPQAIFIGASNGNLYALAFDGKQLWRRAVGGAVHSKPTVVGSLVLVTTYASRLVAVDSASGRTVGEYRASSPVYSSPESDGKRIYFGSNGGIFHAVWLKAPVAS
jgi:outer membrane protein assembly factor BamB